MDGMGALEKKVDIALLQDLDDHISTDWFKLGLTLGLPSNMVNDIGSPQNPPSANPYRMLMKWLERCPARTEMLEYQLRERLKSELTRCHRRDLADSVDNYTTFDALFKFLMEPLVEENKWEKLGVYLGFSISEIKAMKDGSNTCQQTPSQAAGRLLTMWQNTEGNKATYGKLLKAFRAIKRNDLVLLVQNSPEFKRDMGVGGGDGGASGSGPTHSTDRHPSDSSGCQPTDSNLYQPSDSMQQPQQQPRQQPTNIHPIIQPMQGNWVDSLPPQAQQPSLDSLTLDPHTSRMEIDDTQSFHGNQGPVSSLAVNDNPMMAMSLPTPNSATNNTAHPLANNQQQPTATATTTTTFARQQPGPPSTLTNVSAQPGPQPNNAQQSGGCKPMLHNPPKQPNMASRLNPAFIWMGKDMKRLKDGATKARPVYVALLDSGIYEDHPDLKASGMIVHSKNFVPKEAGDLKIDLHDHGTHSAGILWQYGQGIIKIINLKVIDTKGHGNMNYAAEALDHIKTWDRDNPEQKVDIILMPFGQDTHNEKLDQLIDEFSRTKVIICSASNEGRKSGNTITFPANHGKVLAIGSCDFAGNRCGHSGYGPQLTFLFPGENIWSTSSRYYLQIKDPSKAENFRYKVMDGTSFAAPHAGALAALILAYTESKINEATREKFTNCRVMINLLKRTIHNVSHSPDSGHGLPQVNEITTFFLLDFIDKVLGK